ncbi:hypothetical protein GCM10007890_52810 [Methylobacterium tardum]|uniref:Uncharacterized protein n=1 Tax=Methylobacterium tardum TaxID=374432 RepID=A0AA37TG00_9HYPH|nr:hypothetical protein GCM10007890_52810 [Methylobacterium tardum]
MAAATLNATVRIASIVPPIACIASTAWRVSPWIAAIWLAMVSVEFERVWGVTDED